MISGKSFMKNAKKTSTSSFSSAELKQILADGITAIEVEKHALDTLIAQMDDRFVAACQTILACQGRVVVTGMGKSGLIGRKIAATFASTGTPSFFMHPGEAGHGDLGMLVAGDVLLAISNSGESDEIKILLPVIKQLGIPLISISRDQHGTLPKNADIALTLGVAEEACPNGLAPTSSTTATLALGDAIAVALVHYRGFTTEEFAKSHPAGALGRRMTVTVEALMHKDLANLPITYQDDGLFDALLNMTHGRLGMTVVLDKVLSSDNPDDRPKVVGIFTDGDLRRTLEKHSPNNTNILDTQIKAVMTKNPKSIHKEALAINALTAMNNAGITQLLVLNADQELEGIITLHDLLAAGIR